MSGMESGLPSVAQVLALPELVAGRPTVVAAPESCARPVRWVHVAELPDIAPLLRGGELILTTGIALPVDDSGLIDWITQLAGVGVVGVVIESVRRFADGLPAALVRAADRLELPLIALERETQFVRVTEAAHALILDLRTQQLEAVQRIHDIFTEHTAHGATPDELVAEVARLADRPAVLETPAHRVIAAAGPAVPSGSAPESLRGGDPLADWVHRSRRIPAVTRTEYVCEQGCLVTPVAAHGQTFGRLVLLDADNAPVLRTILERGAGALAINHLAERADWTAELPTQQALLRRILGPTAVPSGSAPLPRATLDSAEVLARADSLGVPLRGARIVAMVVIATGEVAAAVILAARDAGIAALAGELDAGRALLLVPVDDDPDKRLGVLAAALGQRLRRPIIGVGPEVDGVRDVPASLAEAIDVAAEAARAELADRPYYRLADLRLRGLLRQLRGDTALASFVDRELGPLLAYDDAHGSDLVGTLKTYLRCGYNKAGAAAAAHLSRPTLYQRLHQIERVLGIDLEDNASRLAVHVAALADDIIHG